MLSMPDRLAALERRIASLEANPAASLRFGSVTGVEGGFARVQLPDGQSMVSALLPTVQSRVLKDQNIKMPDIGEPVACLFSGQGLEAGIVVGACYSPATPDPSQPPHMDYTKYEDGAEICYDREAHSYTIDVPSGGNIVFRIGESTLEITENGITLNAHRIDLN